MRRKKGEAAPEVVLPITPMLDMVFQLLAFFIFNYHPSALEGQMELTLPGGGENKAKNQADVDPNAMSDPDPAAESQVVVKVRTQRGDVEGAGGISLIEITGVTNKSVNTPTELKDYLKQLADDSALTNKDAIKIEADGKLKWRFVVEVMDACKSAGFSNVGFTPPPDAGG